MSEYGKRQKPVVAKALSSEDLARWRSRERTLLSHESEGHAEAAAPAARTATEAPSLPPSEAPADAPADHQQHRHAERHKTLIGAQVVFNDLMSTYDCTIRDLSETGARIKLNAPVEVPKAFLLRFSDGHVRQCKVRRRNALELGIEFLD